MSRGERRRQKKERNRKAEKIAEDIVRLFFLLHGFGPTGEVVSDPDEADDKMMQRRFEEGEIELYGLTPPKEVW